MLPDFLCIGAQKSGTTWLHHNLAQHPLVWLPPTKAIHYFDWPPTSLQDRLIGQKGRMREARAHLRKTIGRALCGRSETDELSWALRFCLSPRSDQWYESLFRRPQGIIAGETCPSYALLPAEEIRRVHGLMPRAKIIYLIRHPVERAWSAAVMHFNDKRRGGVDDNKTGEIEAWLNRPRTVQRCHYLTTISNWEAVFGRNFMVGFYDELRTDPAQFLRKVQIFLELPIEVPTDVGARRNAGNWTTVPQPFRTLLQELFRQPMADLHARCRSHHTEAWLTRYS